jgi:hypothetical protein
LTTSSGASASGQRVRPYAMRYFDVRKVTCAHSHA